LHLHLLRGDAFQVIGNPVAPLAANGQGPEAGCGGGGAPISLHRGQCGGRIPIRQTPSLRSTTKRQQSPAHPKHPRPFHTHSSFDFLLFTVVQRSSRKSFPSAATARATAPGTASSNSSSNFLLLKSSALEVTSTLRSRK